MVMMCQHFFVPFLLDSFLFYSLFLSPKIDFSDLLVSFLLFSDEHCHYHMKSILLLIDGIFPPPF